MNGKLVVRDNGQVYPVRLVHWWPGRKYRRINGATETGIPVRWNRSFEFWFSPMKGTRYMTAASANVHGDLYLGTSACSPKDMPSREVGRFIALLRLARGLKADGLRMERVA